MVYLNKPKWIKNVNAWKMTWTNEVIVEKEYGPIIDEKMEKEI